MNSIDEAKLRFADMTNDGVFIAVDVTGTGSPMEIVWCNKALLDLSGYSFDEVIGKATFSLLGPGSDLGTVAELRAAVKDGRSHRIRILTYRKDGSKMWSDVVVRPFKDRASGRMCWIASQRDATAQVELQEKLAAAERAATEAQERLWAAIEALPDGFVLYDKNDRAVLFNSRYREIYEESAPAITVGAHFTDILRYGLKRRQYPDAIGREKEWLKERLNIHRTAKTAVEQKLANGRFLQIHEVQLPNGDTVGFRTDVTKMKRVQLELAARAKELEIAARTDPLTGLSNRRGLDLALATAMKDCDPDQEFSVLHIDLDRFKPINDVFGHAAGDHLLCVVSNILQKSVRGSDEIARVGGDEFVVFQSANASQNDAITVAERIFKGFRKPVTWNGKSLHFGCSIGISTGRRDQIGELLQNADIALYKAKDAGRGRYHLFTPALRRATEAKKRLSDEILEGLDRNEFIAMFQPQVTATDHSFAGAEALARWNNPKRGLMAPGQFLSVADELGVLSDIETLVMQHAFETADEMRAAGTPVQNMSFNVSVQRLVSLGEKRTLRSLANAPCRVSLELLETIDYDDEINELAWIVDSIREHGIGIELDDFGSGRASLTSLLSLRPDRIKIDRKIVLSALSDGGHGRPLLQAISQMCQALDIPMTAEGVENAALAETMRDLGCDKLQGYHFAQPLTREDLTQFARTHCRERRKRA
ncbi:EAL domain-containing protein [Aliishimia ponticola]|uniref:EAL domain-containing protein n=1 Tax=Aliishimia ponticola TaxID=2499833 RepID=A0A4S4NCE8_9RHOB|nr:EAL domain-containing protein [Aliishimia ponticola]THH37094.1 EAL domain-containing protein [Aliishimia ponticola]